MQKNKIHLIFMKNFIKNMYLTKFIIPRYTKNSEILGEMLSYSYMGEPVGFKKVEENNFKYAQILIKNNIKPWNYNEMAGVGWGQSLPQLIQFKNEFEKNEWIKENFVDKLLTKEIQKTNFASKLFELVRK